MDVLTHLYSEFRDYPEQLAKVVDGTTEVVYGSFLVDGSTQTRNEVKRRTELCARWVLTLRKDCRWSIERILDELPRALRSELDGIPYSPTREGRQTWSADNGRDLIWLPD